MQNIPLTVIPNDDWTFTVISNLFNIVTEWDNLEEAIENWKEALICHIEWLKKDSLDNELYLSLTKSFNTFVSV